MSSQFVLRKKWFKKFNEGNTDLRDEPRSAHSITVNTEAIHDAIEANLSTSTKRLLTELDNPQTSVIRHLNTIGISTGVVEKSRII